MSLRDFFSWVLTGESQSKAAWSVPRGPVTLHCKPDDLARVIVFDANRHEARYIGCIVTVKSLMLDRDDGRPFWILADILSLPDVPGFVWAISDAVLRPIRNPGDEEQDEMIRLVGPAPAVHTTDKDFVVGSLG